MELTQVYVCQQHRECQRKRLDLAKPGGVPCRVFDTRVNTMKDDLCPCGTNIPYQECCKRYHDGAPAENALALMRSRYAAYALNLADYIIRTTHPKNPDYSHDPVQWKTEIFLFSEHTRFEGLKIVEFLDGTQDAYVTFTAYLKQGNRDVSFTEASHFVKTGNAWLYKDGMRK